MTFERTFHVGWGDLDSNSHMANTAYLDLCVDVRFMYFAEQGFSAQEFMRRRLGPVVLRDELDYYRELHLLDTVRINLLLVGISDDGSRFRIRNEFYRADGALAARVTTTGGWLDLAARRLVAPPAELAAVLGNLTRAEDYEDMPSSVKK